MTQRIGLHGIPQNSALTLEVEQRAVLASGQTAGWGPTDSAWGTPSPGVQATITVNRSKLKISPEGMVFKVTHSGFDTPAPVAADAYDPQFHGLYYFWNYGDPGSVFTKTERVMPHQKNANLGYGPIGAHTYENPGSYTVSVLIIEPTSGKWTVAHLILDGDDAVGDPAVRFTQVWQNIYVDPDGDFSWVDPTHLTRFTTLAQAYNLLSTRLVTIPYRIILRDGKTHNAGGQSFDQGGDPTKGYPNIYLGGQGTGTPAVVNHDGSGFNSALFTTSRFDRYDLGKDMVLHDVNFTGPFRETDEGVSNRSLLQRLEDSNDYVLMHNVEVDGLTSVDIVTGGHDGNCTSVFSNMKVSNWAGYAFFFSANLPSAWLGVQACRQINARSGGSRDAAQHLDSTCWRMNGVKDILIDGCEGFSRTGWSRVRPGIYASQPVFRWNNSGVSGSRLNMQRNSFEGGSVTVALDTLGRVNVVNALIERNILVGASQCYAIVFSNFGGITLRNNLMTFMDATTRINGDFRPNSFFRADIRSTTTAGGDLAETLAGPLIMTNNTLMSEWTAANGATGALNRLRNAGNYPNVTEENNVLHDPGAPTPETPDAPFTFTDLFAPRDTAGLILAYERVSVTLASSVATGASITVPYPSGRSAADYAVGSYTAEDHEIFFNDNLADDYVADVAFGDSDMTVINNSGTTWPIGTHTLVLFCPTSPVTSPEYGVTTPQVRLPRPDTGSPALGNADETSCPVGDFFGNLRPIYPSLGAFEALN